MTVEDETHIAGNEIIKPPQGRPSWKNRRRVIFLTLFFCAFCIMYIMMFGGDTRVNETIVLGAFGLAFTTIGFYVAGAAWTDVSIEKIKATGPAGEPRVVKQRQKTRIEVETLDQEDNRDE